MRLGWAALTLAGVMAASLAGAACWLTESFADLRDGDVADEPDADANANTRDADAGPDGDASVPDAPEPPCQPGCGSSATASGLHDCCESVLVPGGTFYRGYDGVQLQDMTHPATVSAFRLDRYEITVGRFRKFVSGYPDNQPAAFAGKNSHVPADPGWDIAWSASLAPTRDALIAKLKCDPSRQTWTDAVGANETKPINCISWYEAFAFCAAAGGRLATDAEWNYAASGGGEQRTYPWAQPPSSVAIDSANAVYAVGAPEGAGAHSPAGDGRWGHADLVGNVWEWVVDYDGPFRDPCTDCAIFDTDGGDGNRYLHGGAFTTTDTYQLLAGYHGNGSDSAYRSAEIGARCAKNP